MIFRPDPKRLFLCVLVLVPCMIYGSVVTHHYGMRDDYSLLREAHEEAGKAIWFTGSHGRPVYGALLQAGFSLINTVDELMWLRLVSVALLTWFGLVLFRQFRASGWCDLDAFAAAITILFIPASQITASWTVGWPWGLSLILAVSGFRLVESSCHQSSGSQKTVRMGAAVIVYTLAALIYQSNALFATVLMAAVLLSPSNQWPLRLTGRWMCLHLATLIAALAFYYGFLQLLFAQHILFASGRLQLETNIISKLEWFFLNPLPNSLAFFTLRDDFNTGSLFFWSAVVCVLVLISSAVFLEPSQRNRIKWVLCLSVLPGFAHIISLVAAERVIGYRTCYALTGLVVVMLFMALRRLANFKKDSPGIYAGMIISLLAVFGYQAWYQSMYLIALPQEREWSMIRDVVDKFPNKKHVYTYLIEPSLDDRSTERVFRDEFGSLSSDSDWTPKEMFKDALHEHFPGGLPKGETFTFLYTKVLPGKKSHFDYLIDMRNLKHWRN